MRRALPSLRKDPNGLATLLVPLCVGLALVLSLLSLHTSFVEHGIALVHTHRLQSVLETMLPMPVANLPLDGSEDEPKQTAGSEVGNQDRVRRNVAVFYTIYAPPDQGSEGIERALAIVTDQLEQIAKSDVVVDRMPERVMPVYYALVGSNEINRTIVERICSSHADRLVCRFLEHVDEGSEVVTLQKAHEYCLQNNMQSVAYIHTKGSFHPSASQHYWRRHGTMAALSKDCVQPPNSTCNACSLLWNVYPLIHNSGNFWTAQCSYINQLVPPQDLDRLSRQWLQNRLIPLIRANKMASRCLRPKFEDEHFPGAGLGRFAAEMWIGSHPSFVPCDLSASPDLAYWKLADRNVDEFEFAMAPRKSIYDHFVIHDPGRLWMLEDEYYGDRRRELVLLPGLLLRYQQLYKRSPPINSWIWTYYPDGQFWKEGVAKFEDLAVDVLNEEFALP